MNENWPHSRGVFVSHDKKFLIWVNEEDQLKVISMQEGADIQSVFQRLATATGLIEKAFSFQKDEKLGYFTSCPSNLGTALRASVHVHLPNLGQDKGKLKELADKNALSVVGTFNSAEADVYDISNSRRLGVSEV